MMDMLINLEKYHFGDFRTGKSANFLELPGRIRFYGITPVSIRAKNMFFGGRTLTLAFTEKITS